MNGQQHLDEINKALGAGEDFPISNGALLKVYPVAIIDLKEAMALYNEFGGMSVQGLYLPGNEDKLRKFEDALLWANGKRDLCNGASKPTAQQDQEAWQKREDARTAAVHGILSQFSTIADQGKELLKYIDRFLGLVPGDTGASEKDQE